MASDKRRLEKTISALEARFGARTVRKLGDEVAGPDRLPTGFAPLDAALGGGLPRGRITEVVGAPTSGMATLALKIVAQAQLTQRAQAPRAQRARVQAPRTGEEVVWLDLGRTFDGDYAARCGVALERLLLVRPHSYQALPILREFVAGDVGVVVCDLFQFDPAEEKRARALSATLEQLLAPLGKSPTILICLVSLAPGVDAATYARQAALPSYATVRLELQRERWLQRREDIYGYRVRVLVAKNKLGRAGVAVKVDIVFDDGIQGNGA